jgi:hypothetical protein
VTRVQRPNGADARARAAPAAAAEANHVGQHTASVEEGEALGADAAHAIRIAPPSLTGLGHVLAVLLGRAQDEFLSRPAGPPQRPVHRGQVHAHPRRLGQSCRDLGQAQVMGTARQVQHGRLDLAGDARRGTAARRLASRRPSSCAAATQR